MTAFILPDTVDRQALYRPWEVLERRRGEWLPSVECNGDFRRKVTRYSPLRFALIYVPHLLKSPETAGVRSLAQHHIAMASSAARWHLPGRHRDIWIAPRGAAKTTWHAILVLWALAHGHRRFAVWLSDSSDQAQLPLITIRRELEDNAALRADFPDLCPPQVGARGRRDSQDTYTARGGASLRVHGLNSRYQGSNIGGARPDIIVCDDIEPDASNYSPAARRKRLETLLNTVLPMNEQAAVVLLGTVTTYDSITHAAVRVARGEGPQEAWVGDEGFTVHHIPAIVEDPATGDRRSFWEQRYTLAYLASIEHTLNYALNFAGWPPLPGGHHWKPDTFRWGGLELLEGRPLVMQLDPAPTAGPTSDYTGMTVGGLVTEPAPVVGVRGDHRLLRAEKPRVVIVHASKFRATPGQLAERVRRHLAANPMIRTVRVEGNQGSALWLGVIQPILPPHVVLDVHPAGRMSKGDRIARSLYFYEERRVLHATRLPDYETDLQRWPDLQFDDLVDSGAHLVRHLLDPFEEGA